MMSRGDKEALLGRLRRDARVIADHFDLEYASITSERANVRARYGACYSDGRIKLRLWNLRTGKPLRYSSLIDTLCHELAHLRHFDHGPQFKRLFQQILAWARRHGIYRPRRGGRVQISGRSAVRVPERNGVKVFVDQARAGDERAPWERWAETLGLHIESNQPARPNLAKPAKTEPAKPAKPARPAKPATPATPAKTEPATTLRLASPRALAETAGLPGQLSLLAGPEPVAPRRRARRPRRPRYAAAQLSLFGASSPSGGS
jgi:GNAT superfamily N-acetyltransferase